MRKSLGALGLVGFLVGVHVAPAAAEEAICQGGPRESWASPEAVTARLSTLIDREFVLGLDKGCYEAEVVINPTTMIDVYVDPITLKVERIRTNGESDS